MAKYNVVYVNGPTGFGWDEDFERLDEVEEIVNYYYSNYSTAIHVFDYVQDKFIFWKDVLTYKPSIDDLHRSDRDYRTKTRSKID